MAWALIYKHNYFCRDAASGTTVTAILYNNKSLFSDKWVSNGITLVSQLLNKEGLLSNYSEFLAKYNIPITLKELIVVFDAGRLCAC